MPELNDDEKKAMRRLLIFGFVILCIFILFLICISCTLNIVISHSQGTNNDVDSDPHTEADIKPNLSLTTPIPGL